MKKKKPTQFRHSNYFINIIFKLQSAEARDSGTKQAKKKSISFFFSCTYNPRYQFKQASIRFIFCMTSTAT